MSELRKFYVSLVEDLNGSFLEFEADSELAVRFYLERHYLKDRHWGLPWCSVYKDSPPLRTSPVPTERERVIIKALCGPLYEEDYRRMQKYEAENLDPSEVSHR